MRQMQIAYLKLIFTNQCNSNLRYGLAFDSNSGVRLRSAKDIGES